MRTWTDLYFHIAQLFAFRATTLVVKATDMSIGVQFPLAADISPIHERFMLASVTFDFENLPFSEVAKAHCGPPFKTSETPQQPNDTPNRQLVPTAQTAAVNRLRLRAAHYY